MQRVLDLGCGFVDLAKVLQIFRARFIEQLEYKSCFFAGVESADTVLEEIFDDRRFFEAYCDNRILEQNDTQRDRVIQTNDVPSGSTTGMSTRISVWSSSLSIRGVSSSSSAACKKSGSTPCAAAMRLISSLVGSIRCTQAPGAGGGLVLEYTVYRFVVLNHGKHRLSFSSVHAPLAVWYARRCDKG